MQHFRHPISSRRCYTQLLIVTTMVALPCATMHGQTHSTSTNTIRKKILGLEKVIAFYGDYADLKSQTFAPGGD